MVMRREDPDRSVTVGANKAYDTAEFVRTCKAFGAEAHAARNTAGRRSNIGEEMAASEAYQASQVHRKRIEEVFGWVKTVARFSKTRHRGRNGRGRAPDGAVRRGGGRRLSCRSRPR